MPLYRSENGDDFWKAKEFFEMPSKELGESNKTGDFPALDFGETKKFNKNGYTAVLEGEMTWGLWVSPEFIEKELPKIKGE